MEKDKSVKPTVKVKKPVVVKDTETKADRIVAALFESDFNVAKACKVAEISRAGYYVYLKNNTEFQEKLEAAKKFYNAVIGSAMMEGIMHSNMELRQKYLSLVPASIMTKSLGGESEGGEGTKNFSGTVTFE